MKHLMKARKHMIQDIATGELKSYNARLLDLKAVTFVTIYIYDATCFGEHLQK